MIPEDQNPPSTTTVKQSHDIPGAEVVRDSDEVEEMCFDLLVQSGTDSIRVRAIDLNVLSDIRRSMEIFKEEDTFILLDCYVKFKGKVYKMNITIEVPKNAKFSKMEIKT